MGTYEDTDNKCGMQYRYGTLSDNVKGDLSSIVNHYCICEGVIHTRRITIGRYGILLGEITFHVQRNWVYLNVLE